MSLLAKLCISAWFFFLAHGLEFHTKEPSAEAAKNGICAILHCQADNQTIPDASHLESMSVYNQSRIGRKTVMATVSAFQSHLSSDCQNQTVGVSGNFSSHAANIQLSISDQIACQSGVFTCELRYVSREEEGHVVESVLQMDQKSRMDTSVLKLTKAFLNDVVDALEKRLADRLDRLDSCNTRTGVVPRETTTCDKPLTSLPREIITMPGGLRVMCDTETDEGSWIIIQRRTQDNVNFNRSWEDYRNGFGELHGDFWLGNDNIFMLTSQNSYTLRVDMKVKNGTDYYATYSGFRISGEMDGYRLHLGNNTGGTAPDKMYYHNQEMFSTPDRDNDSYRSRHCAADFHQGWWFKSCLFVALNGPFNSESLYDVYWSSISSISNPIVFTEMKIRPI